jgi:cation transport ATPase
MKVTNTQTYSIWDTNMNEEQFWFYCGSAEKASEHPISKAIVEKGNRVSKLIEPESPFALPGVCLFVCVCFCFLKQK